MSERNKRRLRKQLLRYPADAVAKILFHVHGKTPVFADDFRHSEHGSWPSRYGQHTITKNGDPVNAAALGDVDGRALGFDAANNEHLDAGDVNLADFGSGDSFSAFGGWRTTALASQDALIGKFDNSNGWVVTINAQDSRVQMQFEDGSNVDFLNVLNASVDDGNPHFQTFAVDRNSEIAKAMVDDNSVGPDTLDISGWGGFANSAPLCVGCHKWGGNIDNLFDGTIGVVGVHPQWIPEELHAYLHECLVTDRTRYAPALDRWVYGTARDGLQRRPIDYLEKHGLWDSAYDVWDANRHVHQVDGEAVTQLPNFCDVWRSLSQRTGTDKPTINGDTERGHPADSIQFTGAEKIKNGDVPSTVDQCLFWGVINPDTGTDFIPEGWVDGGQADSLIWPEKVDDSTFSILVRDDGNNYTAKPSVSVDTTRKMAYVGYVDYPGDYARIVARDSSGTQKASDENTGFTNSAKPVTAVVGNSGYTNKPYEGTIMRRGRHPNVTVSNATQDALLDTLAATEGF